MIVENSFYVNNIVVVSSGHKEAPKYAGEGVALCGPPGESGGSSGSKSM